MTKKYAWSWADVEVAVSSTKAPEMVPPVQEPMVERVITVPTDVPYMPQWLEDLCRRRGSMITSVRR